MRKWTSLLILFGAIFLSGFAQDDDIYFVPSKAKKQQAQQPAPARVSPVAGTTTSNREDTADWAAGRISNRDVDDYNRRYVNHNDSLYEEMQSEDTQSGIYTTRLVRFHSPRVGIYVSSPFYADYYDYWYDYGFLPDYHWSSIYGPWYGWGWSWNRWPYWNTWWGWHSPYWDYCWNWHCGYPGWGIPSWSASHRPSRAMAANRLTSYRPSRNYTSNRTNSSRTGTNVGTSLSRHYRDNSTRPSRNSYGNKASERPSRNYGTSGNSRNTNTMPNRSSSSFGNSSGRPSSSPSMGSSGRSFGNSGASGRGFGGGRSGGGRR